MAGYVQFLAGKLSETFIFICMDGCQSSEQIRQAVYKKVNMVLLAMIQPNDTLINICHRNDLQQLAKSLPNYQLYNAPK